MDLQSSVIHDTMPIPDVFLAFISPFSFRFDTDTLVRFTLAVRKNYRPNPFHNFGHAFAVTQCMFGALVGQEGIFDEIEVG